MGDAGGVFEKFRNSPAYGPVGILATAALWSGLKRALENLRLPDVGEITNCLLALMFSGVYIYSWTQGNPHDGEVKPNELAYEIPLIIAGGYYLANLYPMRSPETCFHYILSLAAIIIVLINGSGANVVNTLGFLVECPMFAVTLLGVLRTQEAGEEVLSAVGILYALAFGFARFLAAGYTVYVVTTKEDVPTLLKVITVALYLSSLLSIQSVVKSLQGGEQRSGKKRHRALSCGDRVRSRTPRRRK